MGPQRSGNLIRVAIRSGVATADTAHPNATNPTAPLRPNVRTRSRDAWVSVFNDIADAGVSVVVTLFGSKDGTGATATEGSWRVIGQLNSGGGIVPGTASGVTQANRIAYTESVPGLLGWSYIWPVLTVGSGGALTQATNVEILGETS